MSGKTKFKISMIIVLFLLMAAVVIYILVGLDVKRDAYETAAATETSDLSALENLEQNQNSGGNTQPSVSVTSPTPTAMIIPTPEPTDSPIVTPTPAPTATPIPTQEPVYGTAIGSGDFTSETGSPMNITLKWDAVTQDADTVSVTLTATLTHYSLHMISYPNVFLSCDGNTQTFSCPEVDTDDNATQQTELASYTFSVPVAAGESKTIPVSIQWKFHGSYGKVDLDVIECGGDITLTR